MSTGPTITTARGGFIYEHFTRPRTSHLPSDMGPSGKALVGVAYLQHPGRKGDPSPNSSPLKTSSPEGIKSQSGAGESFVCVICLTGHSPFAVACLVCGHPTPEVTE